MVRIETSSVETMLTQVQMMMVDLSRDDLRTEKERLQEQQLLRTNAVAAMISSLDLQKWLSIGSTAVRVTFQLAKCDFEAQQLQVVVNREQFPGGQGDVMTTILRNGVYFINIPRRLRELAVSLTHPDQARGVDAVVRQLTSFCDGAITLGQAGNDSFQLYVRPLDQFQQNKAEKAKSETDSRQSEMEHSRRAIAEALQAANRDAQQLHEQLLSALRVQ